MPERPCRTESRRAACRHDLGNLEDAIERPEKKDARGRRTPRSCQCYGRRDRTRGPGGEAARSWWLVDAGPLPTRAEAETIFPRVDCSRTRGGVRFGAPDGECAGTAEKAPDDHAFRKRSVVVPGLDEARDAGHAGRNGAFLFVFFAVAPMPPLRVVEEPR